jgi:hypothetical protein
MSREPDVTSEVARVADADAAAALN